MARIMTTKPTQDLEVLRDVTVDMAIISKLPSTTGLRSIKTIEYAQSDWSRPLKVEMQFANGDIRSFFIKLASLPRGLSIFKGEFESMKLIHSLINDCAVRPVGYGTCSSAPDTHFYISEFVTLSSTPLDMESFCSTVAMLHTKSVSLHKRLIESRQIPARFGFHVTTHLGMLPLETGWQDSWTTFFVEAMKTILAFEREAQGPSEEMTQLGKTLLDKIIPRLLEPLDIEPGRIQPVLIHGDLMLGNARMNLDTKQPTIYDAGSFWGHNECDLGKWALTRYHMGEEYLNTYHKYIPRSWPEEDWQDRILLYSIRNNLLSASHYGEQKDLRDLALRDMRYLVEKYGG